MVWAFLRRKSKVGLGKIDYEKIFDLIHNLNTDLQSIGTNRQRIRNDLRSVMHGQIVFVS